MMRLPIALNGVAPSVAAAFLDLMSRQLPGTIGNTESQPGYALEGPLSPSLGTAADG